MAHDFRSLGRFVAAFRYIRPYPSLLQFARFDPGQEDKGETLSASGVLLITAALVGVSCDGGANRPLLRKASGRNRQDSVW